MNQKGKSQLILLGIVIGIAIVGGISIYMVVSGGGSSGDGIVAEDIKSATSLDYKIDGSLLGQTVTMRFRAKNIGLADFKLRVEETTDGQESKFILDSNKGWVWVWSPFTGWRDLSGTPEVQQLIQTFQIQFDNFRNLLMGWTGGEYTYNDSTRGYSVTIHDILVNPDLPDYVFQPEASWSKHIGNE